MTFQVIRLAICLVSAAIAAFAIQVTAVHFSIGTFSQTTSASYVFWVYPVSAALLSIGALMLFMRKAAAKWVYWLNALLSIFCAAGAVAMFVFLSELSLSHKIHPVVKEANIKLTLHPALAYMAISLTLAVLSHTVLNRSNKP